MKYSSAPTPWQTTLVRPDETECKKAVEWVSQFEAYGGTCTIDALKVRASVFFLSSAMIPQRGYGLGNME